MTLYRRKLSRQSPLKRNTKRQNGVWGGLTNSCAKRSGSKGGKERYTHLNAEFQRTARTDKKAFLTDQCKEIEENNRMVKIKISSRKLEIPREHFMQRWAQERTEMVGT